MKPRLTMLSAAIVLLLSFASTSAVHVGATAEISPPYSYDANSLYQANAPGGAGYEWHLYAYPAPNGQGFAELTFYGPGFYVDESVQTDGISGSYDNGSGILTSTGDVYGDVFVASYGAAACQASVNLYW